MKNVLTFIVFLLVLSCGKDDESNDAANKTDIHLVTGIYINNSEFSESFLLGNPNVFNNNRFVATPNPANDHMSVISNAPISDVWLVPATAQKIFQETDFSEILNSNLYSQDFIDERSEIKLNDRSSFHLILELQNVNPGYYRVFVKIDQEIYWENIYLPDANFQIEDIFDYWN